MKVKLAQIHEAALSLGKSDREKLRDAMDEDFSPPDRDINGMDGVEFLAELNRRHEEALRDPSIMIPWAVVRERAWKLAREGT